MPVFIPCEKKAFRKWRQAGGDVTDATRTEDVKARFGPKLAPAYARHVKSEACAGRRDEMLERKWGLFCKVMERCGRAVGPENEAAYDAARDGSSRQISRWSNRSEQVCFCWWKGRLLGFSVVGFMQSW